MRSIRISLVRALIVPLGIIKRSFTRIKLLVVVIKRSRTLLSHGPLLSLRKLSHHICIWRLLAERRIVDGRRHIDIGLLGVGRQGSLLRFGVKLFKDLIDKGDGV